MGILTTFTLAYFDVINIPFIFQDNSSNKETSIVTEGSVQSVSSSPEWYSSLVDGYWENNIQCRKIYKFFEDGTGNEYDIEAGAEITEDNIHLSRKFKYSIKGNVLHIYWENWDVNLEWVNKNDTYDWDFGIKANLPSDTNFFYETEWVPSDVPPYGNAMYLVKSETGN